MKKWQEVLKYALDLVDISTHNCHLRPIGSNYQLVGPNLASACNTHRINDYIIGPATTAHTCHTYSYDPISNEIVYASGLAEELHSSCHACLVGW